MQLYIWRELNTRIDLSNVLIALGTWSKRRTWKITHMGSMIYDGIKTYTVYYIREFTFLTLLSMRRSEVSQRMQSDLQPHTHKMDSLKQCCYLTSVVSEILAWSKQEGIPTGSCVQPYLRLADGNFVCSLVFSNTGFAIGICCHNYLRLFPWMWSRTLLCLQLMHQQKFRCLQ